MHPLRTCGKQVTVAQCHHPQLFAGHKLDATGLSAFDLLIERQNLSNIRHSSKTSKPANKNPSEEITCFGQRILET
jgi:hypothetical protein